MAWTEHFAPDGRSYFYNARTGESVWERPVELAPPLPPMPASSPSAGFGGVPGFGGQRFYMGGGPRASPRAHPGAYDAYAFSGGGFPAPAAGYGAYPIMGPGPPIQKGKQTSGPAGANLFIFHIPNQMTTRDLFNLFAPYGNVISARIVVERETGRSRGFGFVSYDDPSAAARAIEHLDGFAVHNKRLKVSLKKETGAGPREGMPSGGSDGGGSIAGGGAMPASLSGLPAGPQGPARDVALPASGAPLS